MKKLQAVAVLATLLFSSSVFADDVFNNSMYFRLRDRMRNENLNEYKAAKVCERFQGTRVSFTSQLISVNAVGDILADMDPGIASLPDILLSLIDSDQAEDLKPGNDISYVGQIGGCKFVPLTGTLFLNVTSGRLRKHY